MKSMRLSRQVLLALGVTGAGVLSAEQLTRKQLDQLLDEMAKSPDISQLRPGACCYRPAPAPVRIEYVCPLCKAKTLYENGSSANRWKLDKELERYRQQVRRVRELGLDVSLDETDFCSQCRQDKDTEELAFAILVTVGDRSARTRLESNDLIKLIAFLEKKDVWKDGIDGIYPLKNELPRIRKMLGLDGDGAKSAK